MADKKPVKATYSGTDTNGLAEFVAADTIGVVDGGTGATTAGAALTALGASPTAGSSSVTTLGTIGTGVWEGTDVAVAHGGTGASTASQARTNLGVKIAQVLQAQITGIVSTTSTSFVDLTGVTIAITPSATSSKILVSVSSNVSQAGANTWWARLLRGTTVIGGGADANTAIALGDAGASGVGAQHWTAEYLDSPSTTDATTYKVQWKVDGGTGVVNGWGDGTGLRTSQSTITVTEVLA